MTLELISMVGGGLMGFVFRFIAAQQEAQAESFKLAMQAQGVADDSADRAAGRGGVWVRRLLSLSVIFALIFAPFILALVGLPTFVESESAAWDIFGIFTGGWHEISGYLILPEVRTAMLAVVGFYLGSAQVGKR